MKPNPSISDRALEHVQAMESYVPGKQPQDTDWIKLNTNENPYPPSPRVEAAIAEVSGDSMRKYPSPISANLRENLARHFGLPNSDWAFVGNGSDEILNLLMRVFCGGERNGGYMVPSYSLYPVLLSIQNAKAVPVRYDSSMSIPVEAVATCGANIFFLTSPNAPTGVGIPSETIRRLAESFPGILVIDEAYAAFAEEDAISLIEEFPSLCVTRTFSKSHGLAGVRIGCLLGNPEIVELLDKVRDSYNVNLLSQAAGIAALSDTDYYEEVIEKIKRTRDFYVNLWDRNGWKTYPSQANYIFTEPSNFRGEKGPEVAKSLFDFLLGRKILVRYFGNDVLTESFLRISVGSESEMLTLNESMDQWQKNA
ncbi:MAG: histidinol-phosphate transaminase [Verrucomicrobia bacterium]|nr:histidinol-phosphate transaminase [Verrucomicrobiota bacterium]MDA1064919.1 histidinol-phosphate transaminase [Verrucomicrobiota bacterium]